MSVKSIMKPRNLRFHWFPHCFLGISWTWCLSLFCSLLPTPWSLPSFGSSSLLLWDMGSGFSLPITLPSSLATPPGHTLCRSQVSLLVSHLSCLLLSDMIGFSCSQDKSKLFNMIFKALQNMISLCSFNLPPDTSVHEPYVYPQWMTYYSLITNYIYVICPTHVFLLQILQKWWYHPLYPNSLTCSPLHTRTYFVSLGQFYTPCKDQGNVISSVKAPLIPSKRSFPW